METRVSGSSWTPGTSMGSSDRRRAPGSLARRPSVPLRPAMLIASTSQVETSQIAFTTWPYPTGLRTGSACLASARGTCRPARQLGAASGPTTGSSPALGSSRWVGRGACTLHKRCTSTASSMRASRVTPWSSTDSLAQTWILCPTLVRPMSITSCASVPLLSVRMMPCLGSRSHSSATIFPCMRSKLPAPRWTLLVFTSTAIHTKFV